MLCVVSQKVNNFSPSLSFQHNPGKEDTAHQQLNQNRADPSSSKPQKNLVENLRNCFKH